jgi:NAD+ diphosphatase
MIGFRARSLDAEIAVDHNELDDARWFTRAEVRALADPNRPPDSIESFLLDTWVRAGA